jgi:hypothetical protein
MKGIKSVEDYDNDLFEIFKSAFSPKYPDIFTNKNYIKRGRENAILLLNH